MSLNAGNVFSAINLSEYMYKSLPKAPTLELRNPFDAIALLTHACMLAVGFRLIGLGEDHKIGIYTLPSLPLSHSLTHKSTTPNNPPETTSDPASPQPLPAEWNASSTSNYAFRYAHTQSSLTYLIKISRLGSKAVINGLAIEDEKVHTKDFAVKDFASESSFPHTIPSPSSENEGLNEGALSIRQAFISAGRMTDAASLLKLNIIQKLAPGLQKEGYEDSAHAASHAGESPRPGGAGDQQAPPAAQYDPLRDDPRLPPLAQPHPFPEGDPLAAGPPRRPYPAGDFPPPGFEDEYEVNRPPRGGIERRPLNIGERDLYPPGLGPNDPLRIGEPRIGGGGMHPTFDDPMFGPRGGGDEGEFRGQIPPGARYDPVGPGGPRLPGGGSGGRGGFGGGGPPNPFGGFGGNDFI
ncbi:hypothetical protein ACLMJK_003576 [Lecanora helva]